MVRIRHLAQQKATMSGNRYTTATRQFQMEGEEGVRHKDRTAIHGAVNVSSSLTGSTNNWCIDGIDRHRGW